MERQGKQLEQAMREKERQCIAKRWTRREEADFFRVVSSYGIIYHRKKKAYDWTKFKQLSKLEKKSDEDLTEYYKSFVVMCKKQMGLKLDEENYDTSIEHISEEKARRTLERLELISRIREEVITHPKLDDRLKVCLISADMPEWWIPGKHDRDLLLGVAKHGLGRTDYYILNDPELSFQEILRKKVTTESPENKEAIKLESTEDILKFDKNEILVKLEKGEGTLKIEKVAVKKEEKPEEKEDKKGEANKVELTLIKTENLEGKLEVEKKDSEQQVKVEPDKDVKSQEEKTDSEKVDDKPESADNGVEKQEIKEEVVKKEPEKLAKDVTKETDLCSKQAAELKAMFPDLEVIQPLSRLSQIDTFVLRDRQGTGALDFSETTVAQLFNNAVKWPKEYAIQVRLQHIIYALETKEWPASKNFSAYASGIGNEFDLPIHELPNDPPKRESSTPMSLGDSEVITITTDTLNRNNSSKKRKRHIAIDVETERAKLHALLNSTHGLQNPMAKHQAWENDDSEDSRRSTPISQVNLQPPPAHQQTTSRLLNMPYDLKYPIAKTIGQTTVIPGTSSTLTPIDLSSGLPKMNTLDIPKTSNQDIQNEVQDFSMPSKKQQQQSPTGPPSSIMKSTGNKLDDTLTKLMKRKNCPIEEPVIGKEKKRRKLDEIVLGLSAAKEQSLFPDPSKKPTVTPSVTVTPTSAPISSSHPPSQKPFTITVTSVPSPAPSIPRNTIPNLVPTMSTSAKDSFSTFLAQAEQQNLLLKKQQQQQRKSYEAMIADINKVADFSSKVNSYSHEAKVNKWLAEQNAALAEQPLNADYLAQRRRRPRIDPTLLDWKKLTGDENVSVINRATGKKLTGPKAPTLKRLGQWLMDNPMYDIDPKWSELVKERGNLNSDLQKRLQSGGASGSSKKGTPGRPPLLASPTGSTSSVSSANLATSMASNLSFPTLAGANLSGINSSLLSGLSGLGQFDPKNPLLMPFAGMPNMSALSSMGGLNNLTNMNIFANLAGLGLPGLVGMDPSLATADTLKSTSGSKSKQQKPAEAHTSSKPSTSTSASSIPTTNPFPFFFPNPNLLQYTPLGLGGLNPFALQPGMSAAYDTLAQQCGLLNGNLNPAASPNSTKSTKSNSSRTATSTSASTTTSSSSNKSPRASSRDAQQQHLQQLLLPPETHLLESLSKVAGNIDTSFKHKDKKDEKRKALESLRGMLPTDFSNPEKLKDKKTIPGLTDFTKLLEQASPSTKKSQEQQMKEALEQLSKTEFLARAMTEEQSRQTPKRVRETPERVESALPQNPPQQLQLQEEEILTKKLKETTEKPTPRPTPPMDVGVDIETLLPPSTVVKVHQTVNAESELKQEVPEEKPVEAPKAKELEPVETPAEKQQEPETLPKKGVKRRGKRKSSELPVDPESIREKKNLRSSASRSAAAAAARAEREQAAAKQLESENAQRAQEKHDA